MVEIMRYHSVFSLIFTQKKHQVSSPGSHSSRSTVLL